MRGPVLYLRDRRIGWSLLTTAGVGTLGWMVAWRLTRSDHFGDYALLMVVVVGSLMIAIATLATIEQPSDEVARSTPFPRKAVLTLHLLMLLAWGVLTLLPLATFPDVVLSFPAAVRNLVGFTGLGLAVVPLVGGRWAWTLPTVYGFSILTFAGSLNPQNRALWPLQPDSSTWAWWFAITLLVTGMILCLLNEPARLDDEGEE